MDKNPLTLNLIGWFWIVVGGLTVITTFLPALIIGLFLLATGTALLDPLLLSELYRFAEMMISQPGMGADFHTGNLNYFFPPFLLVVVLGIFGFIFVLANIKNVVGLFAGISLLQRNSWARTATEWISWIGLIEAFISGILILGVFASLGYLALKSGASASSIQDPVILPIAIFLAVVLVFWLGFMALYGAMAVYLRKPETRQLFVEKQAEDESAGYASRIYGRR